MKKIVCSIGIIATALLSITACAGAGEAKPTPTSPPAATKATGQATAAPTSKTESAQPAAGWADIPVYAGAKEEQQLKMQVPGATAGTDYSKVEWRYYTTKDAVAKVADFYKAEMPKKGWKETLWMAAAEGMAWGMYTNKDESVGTGVWVVKQESEGVTGIGVWRGEKK